MHLLSFVVHHVIYLYGYRNVSVSLTEVTKLSLLYIACMLLFVPLVIHISFVFKCKGNRQGAHKPTRFPAPFAPV